MEIIGVVFGLVFTGVGLTFMAAEAPYWLDGVNTTGTVTGKFLSFSSMLPVEGAPLLAHGGGGPKPMVTYRFQDNGGAVINGQGPIGRWKWDALQVGDVIEVCYLESAPTTSRPLGDRSEVFFAFFFPVLGIIFTTSSGMQIVQRIRWIRRQITIINKGQVTSGLVDRCVERSQGRKRPKVCDVHYRYQVAADSVTSSVLAGMQTVTINLGRQLPADGLVVVVYDPVNPSRHTLDLFHARLDVPSEPRSAV